MEDEVGEAGSRNVETDTPTVTLYWRPGCPYCARLRKGLQRAGASVAEINIWDEPAGAAIVRAATGGDETVPALVAGAEVLVNPSTRRALEAISAYAPDLIDPAADSRGRAGKNFGVRPGGRWALLGLVVTLSFLAEATGHLSLSWEVDAVALAAYAVARAIRWNGERKKRVRRS